MRADYLEVRRAYELGRLRASLLRAAVMMLPVAGIAVAMGGRTAFVWLPITFAVWLVAQWRGGPLLRGSYLGLLGGIVTMLMPMTILRPCCSTEAMAAGMDCCTQPSACLTVGALLGIGLAAFLPNTEARWRTAAGIFMGVASVAVLRCSTLFAAEAMGLIGGLAAGVAVTTLSRSVLARRRYG